MSHKCSSVVICGVCYDRSGWDGHGVSGAGVEDEESLAVLVQTEEQSW